MHLFAATLFHRGVALIQLEKLGPRRWTAKHDRTSNMFFAASLSALFLLQLCRPAWGQRNLRDIPPPDPALELAAFKVADGFEVNLWAADPLLAKPTQITFDRAGRMWVSSSQTYPQLNVNQDPNDRIIILEDTNHDGAADASSVYYDQLLIPGGVLPDGRGGAYVAHAKELIHLGDTDGDGKADVKQVLLSGFGTEDTHHTLHRLRWGPGGLMYMLQGYYIGTHVETLYGPRRLNGGGLWSYDTRTRRLEIYSRGLTNPWGMRFDRWGQTFQTDGAGGEGINYSFPDAVFLNSPQESRFLHGLNPKRPKLCGLEIISGRHFPESWRGSLIAADFRANNIDRYTLEEFASGYVSALRDDLLQSTHVSFRPIDMVMGPDGALYVADWYSPIIQHGEVDFRDERRDQVHGRIWRITARGRRLVPPVDYHHAGIDELLELLKRDEDWIRLNAKQELKQRDESEVAVALQGWLDHLDPVDPNYEHHRLEALWLYQTISTARSPELARQLMASPDYRVRAAATRVLYHWPTDPRVLESAVTDPHPRVRREAVTTLGRCGSAEAASIALRVLDHPMDEFLDFALWRTCRQLGPHWLPAFERGEMNFEGNADRMAFALKAVEKPEALGPLIELLRSGKHDDPAIAHLIGKLGSAQDLIVLVQIVTKPGHPLTAAAAQGLLEAAEDRGVQPTSDQFRQACTTLLESPDPAIVAAGCRLVGLWQQASLQEELVQRVVRHESAGRVRQSAARGLADLGHREPLQAIAKDSKLPLATRVFASAALVWVDPTAGANASAELLGEPLEETAIEELMESILVKKGAAVALASALRKRASIPSQNAVLLSRLVETSGHHAETLMKTIVEVGGLAPVTHTLDREHLNDLLAHVSTADAGRGREIFSRAELTCVKCHAVGGKGGQIGPDLSSIGAAAPPDYLIESLIEPSRKIKEGYRMSVIVTEDGDVVSGTVVRENDSVVVMRNAVGHELRVPKSTIESRETSPVSMMPSGLTASLRADEFLDLIAYLASLGKQ